MDPFTGQIAGLYADFDHSNLDLEEIKQNDTRTTESGAGKDILVDKAFANMEYLNESIVVC